MSSIRRVTCAPIPSASSRGDPRRVEAARREGALTRRAHEHDRCIRYPPISSRRGLAPVTTVSMAKRKLAAERLALAAQGHSGSRSRRCCVQRPSTAARERQLHAWWTRWRDGASCRSQGQNLRTLIFADDLAAATPSPRGIRAPPGRIYNVTDGAPLRCVRSSPPSRSRSGGGHPAGISRCCLSAPPFAPPGSFDSRLPRTLDKYLEAVSGWITYPG